MFKLNLNEISRKGYASNKQKHTLTNIDFFCKSRKAIIKLFNDHSSIMSEARYKASHEIALPGTLVRLAKASLTVLISKYLLLNKSFKHYQWIQ